MKRSVVEIMYIYGNRHFWCRGYYVDTVGKNTKKIEEYIKTQLQEDIATITCANLRF